MHEELERLKRIAAGLQEKVQNLCQSFFDIMRAMFTLKYSYKDKSPNPYKSTLTEKADHLIDVLEQKSRVTFLDAGFPDLEKGMGGMGVTAALEQEVKRLSKPKHHEHEIGD